MPRTAHKSAELPPTAGLPLALADFLAAPARPLPDGLRIWLDLPHSPLPVASGTAALAVALHTLRQRLPGRSEVIVPAYTCPLVPLAAGCVPGLRVLACDTLPASPDLDPDRLARLCTERTLAVLPTHLGGRVADVEAAKAIASRCGALVIEDAAQSLGARSGGRSVGLSGDAGFFSLAVGKGLTTYEGGLLFSRQASLQAALKTCAASLLRPRRLLGLRRLLELAGYALFYTPSRLRLVYGRPLRKALRAGDELAAAGDILPSGKIPLHGLGGLRLRAAANALARLPGHLEQGRQRALERLALLRGLDGLSLITDRPGQEGVWPFFMALLPDKEARDRALDRLWGAGVGVTRLFARALPDYAFPDSLVSDPEGCPQARLLADRMLTITNSPWLDADTFRRILEDLRRIL
ncbi:MAG: DegT/DnrJ/EryC1/StrS family aminotransferase [Desulfovibrio sp.]|jgi:dTDP-4-amino-4,6-dideoxygalactose transaminase|nr:DegT/DnrJ/EryC1/StrS family aminotransferase [Desulfovibrio sp.]